jgi:hypothetical protein
MRTPWDALDPEDRRVRMRGLLKALFIIALTVLIFLLAQSMVEHRFFQGGVMKSNGAIGQ